MTLVREEKRIVSLDVYEEGAVVKALSEKRKRIIAESREDFVAKGGATERTSFYRGRGETGERSPRQRDDSR